MSVSRILAIAVVCSFRLLGQPFAPAPESAQTNLYFPHFADGGPADSQWQTTFTFTNPYSTAALVTLHLNGDNGTGVALDLGSGLTSELSFIVPGGGARIFRSRMASTQTVTGWAVAYSTLPLQANESFRLIQRGVAKLEVTAEPTLPATGYFSPANSMLGVAVANVYSGVSLSVQLRVRDSEGRIIGTTTVTVPTYGHKSFNLPQIFPTLPNGFMGSVEIAGTVPTAYFLAWTVNADSSGVISSLPPGRTGTPVAQIDRIWQVYYKVLNAANSVIPPGPVTLQIGYDQQINASARSGNTVQVNMALAELIGDSPGELASVIGHELGHIYQQRTGKLLAVPYNVEMDADSWGMAFAMAAGYDPYAAAGALAKLAMATGTAGLITQFEDQLAPDAHKSFNTRIDVMYDNLLLICKWFPDTCAAYKAFLHPHFPGMTPLSAPLPIR